MLRGRVKALFFSSTGTWGYSSGSGSRALPGRGIPVQEGLHLGELLRRDPALQEEGPLGGQQASLGLLPLDVLGEPVGNTGGWPPDGGPPRRSRPGTPSAPPRSPGAGRRSRRYWPGRCPSSPGGRRGGEAVCLEEGEDRLLGAPVAEDQHILEVPVPSRPLELHQAAGGLVRGQLRRPAVGPGGHGPEGDGHLPGGGQLQRGLQLQPGVPERPSAPGACSPHCGGRSPGGPAPAPSPRRRGLPPDRLVEELSLGDLRAGLEQLLLGGGAVVQQLQGLPELLRPGFGVRQGGVVHPGEGGPRRPSRSPALSWTSTHPRCWRPRSRGLPVPGHAEEPDMLHFNDGHIDPPLPFR